MNINDFVAALERGAAEDAARVLAKLQAAGPGRRGLFIDCGSNLGQGFSQFLKHYPIRHFDYILIEPNPNCLPTLQRIRSQVGGQVEILPLAASTRPGTVKFFGLEHDPTSQGGSMLKDHNSRYYAADEQRALEVPCFSLASLIREKARGYAAVVLKLDIEGGEYEVLPHLIGESVHTLLDAAYIEFHTQYMTDAQGAHYRRIEQGIRERLATDRVPYRVWI